MMVWDDVTGDSRSLLEVISDNLTVQLYTDNVLQPTVLPFLAQRGRPNRFVFQQGNTTPHSVESSKNFSHRLESE